MLVNNLECPNCGASVEFAHGSRVTCPFCKSSLLLTGEGVRTTGTLDELSREPATLADRERPPQHLPASPDRTSVYTPSRKGVPRLLKWGCLFAVLSQVVFVCVCGLFVALAGQVILQIAGPLEQVTTIVNEEPEVVRALGQPIKLGFPTSSNIQSGKQGTTVNFSAPLTGTKDKGKVRVAGRQTGDVWDLDIWVTYLEDGVEQEVFIQRRAVR